MQKQDSKVKRDMVTLLVEQIMFCNHLFLTKEIEEKNKLNEIAGHIEKINPYPTRSSFHPWKASIESPFEIEKDK